MANRPGAPYAEHCGDLFCPALCKAHEIIFNLLDCLELLDVPSGHVVSVIYGARQHLIALGYDIEVVARG